ncbi:MAG: hypothetical protein H6Q90_7192 [Deltaproteobacteria bacterium]|nr:hypothetical protein [Deltaproteobacteria bacterium]
MAAFSLIRRQETRLERPRRNKNTNDGEIGIAIQIGSDAFFEQVLAQDRGPQRRLVVADVDGDGRDR